MAKVIVLTPAEKKAAIAALKVEIAEAKVVEKDLVARNKTRNKDIKAAAKEADAQAKAFDKEVAANAKVFVALGARMTALTAPAAA